MEDSLRHGAKQKGPMRWSDDGRRIEDNAVQFENEDRPISISRDPDSNSTEERARSPSKQRSPIVFTDAGMAIDFKEK
jgi:hypothetical protein